MPAASNIKEECLDKRIGEEEMLKREVKKLEEARNAAGAKIEWRFTTEDATKVATSLSFNFTLTEY